MTLTKEILEKAGFKPEQSEYDKDFVFLSLAVTSNDNRVRHLRISDEASSMYGRDFGMLVTNDAEKEGIIDYLCLQTVEQFNEFMKLLDINFKLKDKVE